MAETRPLNGAKTNMDGVVGPTVVPGEYDPRHTAGALIEDEDDPPFLYFDSIPQAFVRPYFLEGCVISRAVASKAFILMSMLCVQRWLCSWAIPGMGMFCEAYFIFRFVFSRF